MGVGFQHGEFIEGKDRQEQLFLPECLDDYFAEDNPVRVVEVFIDDLDLSGEGFAAAAATGRPGSSDNAEALPLWLSQPVQSSRRLECEAAATSS